MIETIIGDFHVVRYFFFGILHRFKPSVMKLQYKILIHLAYWIYIFNQLLFPYYVDPKMSIDWPEIAGYSIASIITFYAIYFLIPLVQTRKNIWIAVIFSVLFFVFMVFIRHLIEYSIYKYLFTDSRGLEHNSVLFQIQWIYHDIRLTVIYTIYSVLIRLSIGWFDTQKLKNDLLIQTKSSELALLRSQVNPHFLFNTLNNIYSLVYQKSDDAPAAVMKLSSIMRYMLYDATTDKVLLEKEVEYLQSFIELQRLRLRDREFVELTVKGKTEGHVIAPMLLIPFVENAFKHGSKTGEKPGIRILLEIFEKSIRFEVINHVKVNSLMQKDAVGGIGVSNLKRRLELLYPGKHILQFNQKENLFIVDLIIYNV